VEQIEKILADQDKLAPPVSDELPLINSGLDSLGLAVLVARLEDKLGVDPFTRSPDAGMPLTVGDLIRLYEHAAV
jgi:hypothetical protein